MESRHREPEGYRIYSPVVTSTRLLYPEKGPRHWDGIEPPQGFQHVVTYALLPITSPSIQVNRAKPSCSDGSPTTVSTAALRLAWTLPHSVVGAPLEALNFTSELDPQLLFAHNLSTKIHLPQPLTPCILAITLVIPFCDVILQRPHANDEAQTSNE